MFMRLQTMSGRGSHIYDAGGGVRTASLRSGLVFEVWGFSALPTTFLPAQAGLPPAGQAAGLLFTGRATEFLLKNPRQIENANLPWLPLMYNLPASKAGRVE